MTHPLSQRLHAVIPGGAHTYSRGDDQFPSNAPPLLLKGKGSYVWDTEGKKYLDFGMALRAVTLGYAHDTINQAAIAQIENGVNLTRATQVELDAAELLVGLIPGMDMVKFAKNGSTVTTAAAKVARAYTGKKYICFPKQHPFFSFDDWFIGTTALKRGIPEEHYSTSLLFDYNDILSLDALFAAYPDQIAGVILEPSTTITPCSPACAPLSSPEGCPTCRSKQNSFLHEVKTRCHTHGALFILDEMITGFRWHLQGAQTYFGVEPDLCTFGKGMANGFSVAALVGKREFMNVGGILEQGAERTFLISTTHGAEMPGLGAFIATVDFYKKNPVISHLWSFGKTLKEKVNAISTALGIQDYFYLEGPPVCLGIMTKDNSKTMSFPFRTLFLQEMLKKNILMPYIAMSYAHEEPELDLALAAINETLIVYKKALEDGVENYVSGPIVKPVFRTHN